MLFHKQIEGFYQKQLFVRCDDVGLVRYFSHEDFDGLAATPFSFSSSKGHLLNGFFYTYQYAAKSPLVIFEHGFGGGHRSYMKEIETLCRAGYTVFAYDHTGCMTSGGEHAGGFSTSLCDLDDCLKALKADPAVATERLYVIGHSWGGLSTLNIAALHPDVEKIVVLSGPLSVKAMVDQNFSGVLKGYRKHVYALEESSNPDYVGYDAITTLQKAKTRALFVYSDNDRLVKKEHHYDRLYAAFHGKEGREFLLEGGKGHNPNYSHAAVALIKDFASLMKRAAKAKTEEEKAAFRTSQDFDTMTEQDPAVWDKIFLFLRG